jgi:hypothetical protein
MPAQFNFEFLEIYSIIFADRVALLLEFACDRERKKGASLSQIHWALTLQNCSSIAIQRLGSERASDMTEFCTQNSPIESAIGLTLFGQGRPCIVRPLRIVVQSSRISVFDPLLYSALH